jgi:hypothetical protein
MSEDTQNYVFDYRGGKKVAGEALDAAIHACREIEASGMEVYRIMKGAEVILEGEKLRRQIEDNIA